MKKLVLILLLVCSCSAWAGKSVAPSSESETETVTESKSSPSWICRFWHNLKSTWASKALEFVLPVNTWHNRWVYDHSKVHHYNERPWGAGVGKYRHDEDGDRHQLVAIVFQDSHNKPEPTFAYGWQHVFRQGSLLRPTLGFMTGVTFRDDYSWLPIPAILPVVGLDIGDFSVESTYIPGLGTNNGHVLFTWATWRF